ncbi:MAG TPA: methyltransferase domain-containing protein [Bacteroidota bacterium]|nr:methyltransferase domain-containing protein [Bacteroidota bacterium]
MGAPSACVNDPGQTIDTRAIHGSLFLFVRDTNDAIQRQTTSPLLLDSFGTSLFLGSTNLSRSHFTPHSAYPEMNESKYAELIAREAQHWGEVRKDPENPQIWHDPVLFELFFGSEYRHLVDSAVSSGPRVLELGCGEGALSINLASRGLRVTGIDLSPERIARARAAAAEGGLQESPSFAVGDLNTIQLDPEQYDCVVAHDSLHHVLRLGRLCDEVNRTLRPGGRFLVIDYVGMGLPRRLLAGLLYAVLPTYQPYRKKWGLRKRMRAFLASEKTKREAIEKRTVDALHHDSPFEEISQSSIIQEISERFTIVEQRSFCPFWFYLAAKVRMVTPLRYPMARMMKSLDDLIVRLRIARGAYVWISAQKPITKH